MRVYVLIGSSIFNHHEVVMGVYSSIEAVSDALEFVSDQEDQEGSGETIYSYEYRVEPYELDGPVFEGIGEIV